MKIQLTKGYEAIIDGSDYELICGYKWFALETKHTVYAASNAISHEGRKTKILMHRLIMNAPKGLQVDHVDHNGINNRKENLRICSISQNQMNRSRQANNTSGFRGVTWHRGKNKWMAQIKTKGKYRFLGYFLTPQDAYSAYCEASRNFHGEYSNV